MKALVLTYLKTLPMSNFAHQPESVLFTHEVEYDGHKWRAVPKASSTRWPHLELVSQTSTTIVAVPVPVVMKVLVVLKVQMDYFRVESKLIGLCNRSV